MISSRMRARAAVADSPWVERQTITRRGSPYPLGASVHPAGVNFSVSSKGSTRVELMLFDGVDDARPSAVIPLYTDEQSNVPLLACLRAWCTTASTMRRTQRTTGTGATSTEPGTAEWRVNRSTKRSKRPRNRQVKNLPQLLCAGAPILLMGDEVRRTQRGNNNAYCQDNDISWLRLERYSTSHWGHSPSLYAASLLVLCASRAIPWREAS